MYLIKLGGSLLTNKSKPYSLNKAILTDVVSQLVKAHRQGARFILGHGSGSFGHVPAEKYQTHKGLIGDQGIYGAAVVEDAACQLNRLVVAELLKQSLPAITIRPFDVMMQTPQGYQADWTHLHQALGLGFVPVVYGDVVISQTQSVAIASTETVLNHLATHWQGEVSIEAIVHCGQKPGFMIDNQVVKIIDSGNIQSMKAHIHTTEGFDVTGGMEHKLSEAYETAKMGIKSYIIGGSLPHNIYHLLMGKPYTGTLIKT